MIPFFRFPFEIREQIYRDLQSPIPGLERMKCLNMDHIDRSVLRNMLRISKQFSAEVEPVLLLKNTYHHYLEQTPSRNTFSSPAAEQSLARVLILCPFFTSLHLHLILPNDLEICDPVGQDISGLIARMARTTDLLLKHPNLEKVLLSAEKPLRVDPTRILPGTQGVSFAFGLYALRERYKEVLAQLQALPARIAVVFGAVKPNLNGLRASSAEGYVAMCEYILYQRIHKMFTSRAAVVGCSAPEAQAVDTGKLVEKEEGGAELEELETKETKKEPKIRKAEEATPALEVGI